jgi:osmotically-inducible protein OsmY
MKTLIVLILGAALGMAAYIYFKEPQNRGKLDEAGEDISAGASELKDKVNSTFTNLDTEQIKEELAETGRVVRKKAEAAGAAIKDVASDSKITAEIKSRYALDRDLSVLSISINTTDGRVTLAGSVESPEHIKKAMRMALETEGVTEVTSTLQVKKAR